MTRWFRFYDCALEDPKVQRLPAPLFKTWVNLLCLASRHGGNLPNVTDLAWALRMDEEVMADHVEKLMQAGLIDTTDAGMTPHNWHERQYQSDSSAERMRRHRERKRNSHGDDDGPGGGVETCDVTDVTGGDVTVTLQNRYRADTDTDTEKNREDDPAARGRHPREYAFEAGVIRLAEIDLARWVKIFDAINVKAELYSLSEWAGKQKNWFNAVSGALAKKDRDARMAVEKIKAAALAGPAPVNRPKEGFI